MNWREFYFKRSINLTEANVQDLIVAAHKVMTPDQQAKVNKILTSPTWGDSWANTIQSAITQAQQRGPVTPQAAAAIMLDGIDSYLGSQVTGGRNSGRVGMNATTRQATGAGAPQQARADYQGNFGKTQTLWARGDARHGAVPDQEIRAKGLHQNHNLVWSGPPPAPATYPYSFNKRDNKIVYNPNYSG